MICCHLRRLLVPVLACLQYLRATVWYVRQYVCSAGEGTGTDLGWNKERGRHACGYKYSYTSIHNSLPPTPKSQNAPTPTHPRTPTYIAHRTSYIHRTVQCNAIHCITLHYRVNYIHTRMHSVRRTLTPAHRIGSDREEWDGMGWDATVGWWDGIRSCESWHPSEPGFVRRIGSLG